MCRAAEDRSRSPEYFFFHSLPLFVWESYPALPKTFILTLSSCCGAGLMHCRALGEHLRPPTKSSSYFLQGSGTAAGLSSGCYLPLPGTPEMVMRLRGVGHSKRKTLSGVSQCWRNCSYCSGSLQRTHEHSTFEMTTTLARHYLNSRQLWKHLARKRGR